MKPGSAPLLADAKAIRDAAQRRKSTRRPQQPPEPPEQQTPAISPEAAQFWGRQYAAIWNQLAADRGWPLMPGAPVDAQGTMKMPDDPAAFLHNIGEPVARTVEGIMPAIDQRPWLQVVVMTMPFVMGAMRIEGRRVGEYLRARRDAAAGRPPGGTGTDRPGKDGVRPGVDASGLSPGLSTSAGGG